MNEQKNEIVVYRPNETIRLDVRLENETVWLTQEQIANLFGTKRPAITKHLANIYKSGELERESTCSILEHMGNEGRQSYRTMFYNLDAILSVGYRVNSRNATLFRRWATNVLRDYLLRGYAINQRLNALEDKVDRRMAKLKSEDPSFTINHWMRARMTIEYLGLWETLYNPDFKPTEFGRFKEECGLNTFVLSPTKWIANTNAIGIVAQSGRYGGTYARSDIAIQQMRILSEVEGRKYLK